MAAALRELAIASTPRVAPITLERSSVSLTGRAPIRMVEAILFASSYDSIGLMDAWPPLIASFTFGEEITSLL